MSLLHLGPQRTVNCIVNCIVQSCLLTERAKSKCLNRKVLESSLLTPLDSAANPPCGYHGRTLQRMSTLLDLWRGEYNDEHAVYHSETILIPMSALSNPPKVQSLRLHALSV